MTPAHRGFTLVELLVVVGIFTLITGVILANHSRFNSSVLLGSLAYDIALSVREAQVYGLSVRGQASNFQVGYGVHFTLGGSYVLFADTDKNKKYDPAVDSTVSTYTLQHGHTISRLCGLSGASQECSDSSSPINSLDVVFVRPNPDANIGSASSPTVYSEGKITVRSTVGETRTIDIVSTGQISVKSQ